MAEDTRSRILSVALEEFSVRGYSATSLRELAERLGVSKAAVLYHFPSKQDIVTALAEPMLADMEAAVAVPGEDPEARRWAVMERLIDVWLAHRYLLRMGMRDMALAANGPVFERFREAMALATHVVAGPVPDLTARIRAIQMLGMLSDPVVIFADLPSDLLREQVLAGVRIVFDAAPPGAGAAPLPGGTAGTPKPGRTLRRPASRGAAGAPELHGAAGVRESGGAATVPGSGGVAGVPESRDAAGVREPIGASGELALGGAATVSGSGGAATAPELSGAGGAPESGGVSDSAPGAAPHRGSRRGRPRALSEDLLTEARRLRATGDLTVAQIAERLGVSRATLFRHL